MFFLKIKKKNKLNKLNILNSTGLLNFLFGIRQETGSDKPDQKAGYTDIRPNMELGP